MAGRIYPITSQPGIKRDGTTFASRFYIDGQWCRFQRGLPRKMGGYSQLIGTLANQPRGLYVIPATPNFNVYVGDYATLQYFQIDEFGNLLSGLINRTPLGFVPDVNNIWTFDTIYSTVTNTNLLIAHAAPNLASIGNDVATPVYYGPAYGASALLPNFQTVSGGIAVFQPYLFMFGDAGEVIISNANDPTTVNNVARVAANKIVAGMSSRGGNSSPAGLLWSLNSVIRVTTVNTSTGLQFKFDTVSNESSILSSRSVVEYDGLYFWAGIDRFLVYNGVVQEVPNQMNLNFFFYNNGTTGLNYQYRQKVWATKVPQYGEIWWFYPAGTSTECNHAVIYNKRENTWYDTPISRGCGYFEQVFADPIWADNIATGGTYGAWQHESGVDQNINGTLTAINSFVQTGDVAWAAIDPAGGWTGVDRWVDIYRIEPDLLQNGTMTVTVSTKDYANATPVLSAPYSFAPGTLKIDTRVQGREMSLIFQNNNVGGFYEINQTLLYFRTGDARAT